MKPTSILSTIIGAALAMSAMAANAVSIRVTDGTAANTFTCADGAACDTNPVAGVVSFNTSVGTVWTTAGGTGFGPNLVPGLTLDLNAFQLSTTAGGSIQVLVSQDGFTNDSVSQFIAIGGTSDGTIQMRGYAGAGLFDLTTLLADTGILGGNPFSGSASSGTLVKGPYSLTIWTEIKHTGAGITTYDAKLVPEPGTLALLGLGLLGIGAARRTRKSS